MINRHSDVFALIAGKKSEAKGRIEDVVELRSYGEILLSFKRYMKLFLYMHNMGCVEVLSWIWPLLH